MLIERSCVIIASSMLIPMLALRHHCVIVASSLLLLMTSSSAEICTSPVCAYEFVIRRVQTMTYTDEGGAVFNVALNGTDLVVSENAFRRAIDHPGSIGRVVPPDRVITADGYVRDVIVINDQFPGPTLEVMEGSQVNKHGSRLTMHYEY